MAFAPVQLLATPMEDYAAWWLKFYDQGTVTPLSMATDATGGTLLAKAEVSSGGTVPPGFFKTSGNALLVPFVDGDYDGWLFPTEDEADADDTTNAIQLADNINADLVSILRSDLASTDPGKGASLIVFESGETVQDLASTDIDDHTKGNHLIYFPPLSTEIGVIEYEYYYDDPRRFGADITGISDSASAFINCFTSISASGGGFINVVPGIYLINIDMTVFDDISVKMQFGATFNVSTGILITWDGGLEAQPKTLFTGLGAVSFDGVQGRIVEAYPEWWGAVADGAAGTDSGPAFALCFTAANGNMPIQLQNGEYRNNGTELVSIKRMNLRGASKEDTQLTWTGGAGTLLRIDPGDPGTLPGDETSISEMSFDNKGTGTIGIQIDATFTSMSRVRVFNTNNWTLYAMTTDPTNDVNYLSIDQLEVRSQANPGGVLGFWFQGGSGLNITNSYFSNFDIGLKLGTPLRYVRGGRLMGNMFESFDPQNSLTAVNLEVSGVAGFAIIGNRFQGDDAGHRCIKVTDAWRGGEINGNSFDGTGKLMSVIEFANNTEEANSVEIKNNNWNSINGFPVEITGTANPNLIIGSNANDVTGNNPTINPVLTDQDETPSVGPGNRFVTANTVATIITNLTGVKREQEKTVMVEFGDNNTTVDFTGSTLKGNQGVNWSPSMGDHMLCIKNDLTWFCLISDNTV